MQRSTVDQRRMTWWLLALILLVVVTGTAFLLLHSASKDCSKYGSPQPPGPGCVGPN